MNDEMQEALKKDSEARAKWDRFKQWEELNKEFGPLLTELPKAAQGVWRSHDNTGMRYPEESDLTGGATDQSNAVPQEQASQVHREVGVLMAVDPAGAAPLAEQRVEIPCTHEWYQGACVHCEITVKAYRATPAVQLRADGAVDIDWSMVRSILMQGAAIQQDYQAGKFATYEHYSARMDAAARERIDELSASPAAAKEFPKPSSRIGKDPCGECHLQPGERCDICGAVADIDPRNCV